MVERQQRRDCALAGAKFGFLPGYRLRKTDEFSSVFAFRRSVRVGMFQFHQKGNNLNTARLGVVVAKRFVVRAVSRNRIKRIVREAFRLSRESLTAVDIVVRVCSPPVEEPQMKKNLAAGFRMFLKKQSMQ